MKRLPIVPILLALLWLAAIPGASAQNLPSSMAYSVSAIVRAPANDTQKILIAGNSLIPGNSLGLDLSRIPSAPESVVRRTADSGESEPVQSTGLITESEARKAKLGRSAALFGVLAIAYLITRRNPEHRVRGDISELRNFPKKRLAHTEAHA